MSAYILADLTVTDETKMVDYRAWSTQAMVEHGAEVMIRGGEPEVMEGPWAPTRIVMLRFKDRAAARAFYVSQTYSHARTLREGAGIMRMVLVEGPDVPAVPAVPTGPAA